MTDEEISQRYNEIYESLTKEYVPKKFPDWNAAVLAKIVDGQIFYQLCKEGRRMNQNKKWFNIV